jgi:rhomboid protease GluP
MSLYQKSIEKQFILTETTNRVALDHILAFLTFSLYNGQTGDDFMTFRSFLANAWESLKKSPVTTVLFWLNILAFLAQFVAALAINPGSFFAFLFTGFPATDLARFGGIWPALIRYDGSWWRLLTAMFLHGGLLHIASNLFALYVLGRPLEDTIGWWRYLIVYGLSGLGSGLAVVFLGAQNTVTIGASGAIYGIIGALLYLTFQQPHWFTPAGVRSVRSLMVLNLVFTFLIPGISIAGHLGGLVVGVLTMIVLLPKTPWWQRRRRRFDHGYETVLDGDGEYVN